MVAASKCIAIACAMTLRDLLDRYLSTTEASRRYVESLLRTVRKAEGSGIEKVCQLQPQKVNDFLASLSLSDTTRHNIRRELLTLWRYAHESELTEVFPSRVRKIRPRRTVPAAWTMPDLRKLLAAARKDETPVSRRCKLRRCDVLPAWIGLAYDTGFRFGDVHALREENVGNGCVTVVASKTGKPTVRAMSAGTAEAVAALLRLSPDGSLFLWALPRRRAVKMWRAFLDAHGFRGSSKWLRRSCATQKHLAERGSATDYLQHSDPRLVYVHYLDMSQFGVPVPPPPIETERASAGA